MLLLIHRQEGYDTWKSSMHGEQRLLCYHLVIEVLPLSLGVGGHLLRAPICWALHIGIPCGRGSSSQATSKARVGSHEVKDPHGT